MTDSVEDKRIPTDPVFVPPIKTLADYLCGLRVLPLQITNDLLALIAGYAVSYTVIEERWLMDISNKTILSLQAPWESSYGLFLYVAGSFCYAFSFSQCAKLNLENGRWTPITIPSETPHLLTTATVALLDHNTGWLTPVFPTPREIFWIVSTATDEWTQVPSLGTSSFGFGATMVGGKKGIDVKHPNQYVCVG